MKKKDKHKQIDLLSPALGVSKAVLIALYSIASSFSRSSVSVSMRDLEEFIDRLEGINREQLQRSLYYLQSKKLISIQKEYDRQAPRLTKVGWLKARKLAKSFVISRPVKWDKKWRMVIFDIPVEKKLSAEAFRADLKLLGLANLQKSIWVYPFECRDQVYYLAEKYDIQPCVRYVVADYVTGEEDLKQRFEILS